MAVKGIGLSVQPVGSVLDFDVWSAKSSGTFLAPASAREVGRLRFFGTEQELGGSCGPGAWRALSYELVFEHTSAGFRLPPQPLLPFIGSCSGRFRLHTGSG